MRPKHKLVVKRERHGRRRLVTTLVAVLVVGVILALAAAFLGGERWGGYRQLANRTETAKVTHALAAQSAQNAALKVRVAFLQHSLSLANASASALKANMATQQDEFVKLKQELDFYQGLVNPSGAGGAKVRIGGLQLLATTSAREYHFQIVLVRADGKTGPALAGTCEVAVSGTRNGKEVHLPLKTVAPGSADPLHFTLRYFTNLSGTLTLPAGFTPEEVEVRVQMHGDPTVTGTYSWPVFRG
ncbi:MAG: DUF6776 family protein [Gammaproteobacteria bacterium]